ncbi:unnamed protein product [Pleuronectes platessa]|uniref:Uncharacterized protein n=1 Tax=Pleuronectes platessa TaxID=8262 RepID=A0A9N7TQK9_PLEPL|nr:unnamed protein product [Pleuronectes platessa]
MTTELGVCVNKMLPLSRRLLAASENHDLPPPLIPPLSPATNQVCQTTFSLGWENGRLLSKKKEAEDEQSLEKGPAAPQSRGTFVFSLSVEAVQMSAAGVWNVSPEWSFVSTQPLACMDTIKNNVGQSGLDLGLRDDPERPKQLHPGNLVLRRITLRQRNPPLSGLAAQAEIGKKWSEQRDTLA